MYRKPTAQVLLDWGASAQDTEVGLMWDLLDEVLLGNDLGLLASVFTPTAEIKVHPVTSQLQAREAASSHSIGAQVRPTNSDIDSALSIPTWDSPKDFERETL